MIHILRSQQFDRSALDELFASADKIGKLLNSREGHSKLRGILSDYLMFEIFYEPSTRTRFSFGSAACHLGMSICSTENAAEFSSAIKGESLADSIRALCELRPDVIVLRHKEDGAAEEAASIIDKWDYPVSVINAGDGRGQHPTQSLLDLYTIKHRMGTVDGLTVAIGGDLKNGRTARSLAYLLSKFDDVKLIFVSPRNLRMKPDLLAHLREHQVPFEQTTDMARALSAADVVYWTRVQTERGSKAGKGFSIGIPELNMMKPKSILMHPLPRITEIAAAVDEDPRAVYFDQVGNGLLIRMALLLRIFGETA